VRVTYPDGREQIHALDRDAVEYHRSFSKQPDGDMWSKSYDAAALKSVVLDMKRWLPNSRQLSEAIAADDQVYDVREMDHAGDVTPTRDAIEAAAPDPDDAADAAWVAEAQGTEP
jgi:recombinational DNA repair protein RecT